MLANCNCFMLLRQAIPCALFLAFARAGKSIAARMAMIAITTSSSISVKLSFLKKRLSGCPLELSNDICFITYILIEFNSHLKTVSGSQHWPAAGETRAEERRVGKE